MSRAFVKEQDGDEVPERPRRPMGADRPNYITPQGLAALQAARAEAAARVARLDAESAAEAAALRGELARVGGRLAAAVVGDDSACDDDEVRFGARVRLSDEEGRESECAIVGEDELDIHPDAVAWSAPLGRALVGAHVGEWVTWRRPAGDVEYEILEVSYGLGAV